jgi:hypothetical protein
MTLHTKKDTVDPEYLTIERLLPPPKGIKLKKILCWQTVTKNGLMDLQFLAVNATTNTKMVFK